MTANQLYDLATDPAPPATAAGPSGPVVVVRLSTRPDPRVLFDPRFTPPAPVVAPVGSVPRARTPRHLIREAVSFWNGFYSHRLSYVALVVTSLILCYGGGAVMFWFHAVKLGEGGPSISPYAHWFLDSTFGFVALTPALAVIIPLAAWISSEIGGAFRPRLLPWLYAVVAAILFAFITVPGPLAHDMLVGRGTFIANHATSLIGNPDQALMPNMKYPVLAALTQQLGAAVPIYLVCSVISVLLLRVVVAARRPAQRRAA